MAPSRTTGNIGWGRRHRACQRKRQSNERPGDRWNEQDQCDRDGRVGESARQRARLVRYDSRHIEPDDREYGFQWNRHHDIDDESRSERDGDRWRDNVDRRRCQHHRASHRSTCRLGIDADEGASQASVTVTPPPNGSQIQSVIVYYFDDV